MAGAASSRSDKPHPAGDAPLGPPGDLAPHVGHIGTGLCHDLRLVYILEVRCCLHLLPETSARLNFNNQKFKWPKW